MLHSITFEQGLHLNDHSLLCNVTLWHRQLLGYLSCLCYLVLDWLMLLKYYENGKKNQTKTNLKKPNQTDKNKTETTPFSS